mmetsp:Transcript_7776/g.17847  ORF Transcript_7776/g.17847 Transcript_7776/m.17847 type:complete len:250 (-) Transcript_7776:5-754(-)
MPPKKEKDGKAKDKGKKSGDKEDDGGPKDDYQLLGPLIKSDYRTLVIANRDVEYLRLLDRSPEEAEKHLAVVRRQNGMLVEPWIRTMQQVLIARAALFGLEVRWDQHLKRFQIVGDEGLGLSGDQLSSRVDRLRNEVIGKAAKYDIVRTERPHRFASKRVVIRGGSATVDQLELAPKDDPSGPISRFEMNVCCPTAILDRPVVNGRRRVVLKILRMGNMPMRLGVTSAHLEPGESWTTVFGGIGGSETL